MGKDISASPTALLNLIHYKDAASLVIASLLIKGTAKKERIKGGGFGNILKVFTLYIKQLKIVMTARY